MHKADIKKITQKAKHLFAKGQVFILTDPDRNPDLLINLADTPTATIIIYRSFGAPIPELKRKDKERVLASVAPKIARKAGIKGIHIPNNTLKNYRKSAAIGLMTSVSAHNMSEIMRAKRCGLNNIIISAIFPSKSKSAGKPKGIIKLLGITRLFPKQKFIALGGIKHTSLKRLNGVKIAGIAGVSFN